MSKRPNQKFMKRHTAPAKKVPVYGDGYLAGFLTKDEARTHVRAGTAVWTDAKKTAVNDSPRAIAALKNKPFNKRRDVRARTRSGTVKDDFKKTPYELRKEQDRINYPDGKYPRDTMRVNSHLECDIEGNVIQHPLKHPGETPWERRERIRHYSYGTKTGNSRHPVTTERTADGYWLVSDGRIKTKYLCYSKRDAVRKFREDNP